MATKKKVKTKRKKAPAKKTTARKKATAVKKKTVARRAVARKQKKPSAPMTAAAAPKPAPARATRPAQPSTTPPPQPAAAAAAAASTAGPGEERVGVVTHYYTHLGVAVVRLESGSLRVGDTIHIRGHTSDFRQRVESMQIEHQPVTEVRAGQEFGLKVVDHAREHDIVFKVTSP